MSQSATVTIARVAFDAQKAYLEKLQKENEELRKGKVPEETQEPQEANQALQDEIEKLRAELHAAKAAAAAAAKNANVSIVAMKVSEKGGVSVYGLGRFPVTLYKEQWLRLIGMKQEIASFILDHERELSTKPVKE